MVEIPGGNPGFGFGLTRAVRVLVVDDVLLTREGAAEILRRSTWMEWVRCCADLDEAARALLADPADVVLVNATTIDVELVMRRLGTAGAGAGPGSGDVAVVAFGVAHDGDDMLRCVELGLSGFVLRSAPLETLFEVLAGVAAGRPQCPPEVVPLLLKWVASQSAAPPVVDGSALTARESQVLELIEGGLSNKDIALCLGIKAHTVKNHLHHVYDKLRVSTRGEAAAKARAGRLGFQSEPAPLRAAQASRQATATTSSTTVPEMGSPSPASLAAQ